MMKSFLFAISLLLTLALQGQEKPSPYIAPSQPEVLAHLRQWQDMKFGLLMHWGPYSQWGVVESWSICPEDEGWTQRQGPYSKDYNTYKTAYENLQTSFNPTHFDADKWARAAHDAGMQYVVFTFKHHDGFCMFDSKYTDYKITSPKTPFHTQPKANVAKEITRAFRGQGMQIGAYFSKPDWHCPDYWWPYFPPKDRNVNYDPAKYPDHWKAYKDFTFNQIQEILSGGYGKIDILWLDGGWVQPLPKSTARPKEISSNWIDQDIDMDHIAAMGRSYNPALIVVDRAVGSVNENYHTPEQQIPDKPLDYPWETCMTMGNSWSYVPGDQYKSAFTLIHYLVDIVAKGGNYLLNIGPGPDGDFDPEAYKRLTDIGNWLKINGMAIYNTRPIAPYKENNICFTHGNNGPVYAIYLCSETETTLPEIIHFRGIKPKKGASITLLGNNKPLKWKTTDGETLIQIPEKLRQHPPSQYAWAFCLGAAE